MNKNYAVRLKHMLEEIGYIKEIVDGRQLAELEQDGYRRRVLERSFEVLSEASRHLPDELKPRHSGTPWRQIAGLGNILRHDYERIDLDILYTIARDNLQDLEQVASLNLMIVRND